MPSILSDLPSSVHCHKYCMMPVPWHLGTVLCYIKCNRRCLPLHLGIGRKSMVCTRSVLDSIGRIRLRIFRNFSVRFDSNIFRLGNFCTSPFPSDLDAGRLGSPGSHWPSLLRRTRTLCNCSSSRVDSLGTYLSRSLKKKKKIMCQLYVKKKEEKKRISNIP